MSNPEDYGSLFNEPLDLQTSVGAGEIEARKILGNDRYEKIVAHNDAEANASLKITNAAGRRLNNVADAYGIIPGVVSVVLLLAICWSIFAWITWALH